MGQTDSISLAIHKMKNKKLKKIAKHKALLKLKSMALRTQRKYFWRYSKALWLFFYIAGS